MKKSALLLAGLLCGGLVQAETNETQLLIQGCAEVEAIYESRDKKNLLAGINTSVAEALRAGYCKGVLEQYRRNPKVNCWGDWVGQARRIAEYAYKDSPNADELLSKTCG